MENTQLEKGKQQDIVQEFFENFDLKLFLYILKRTLFFILIILFFSLLLPFLYIRYVTPIYETKATLIKKKEIKNSILDEKNTEFLKSNDEEKINRDIQVIKSDFLLENIVDSLNLSVHYYKVGRIPGKRFELHENRDFTISPAFFVTNKALFGKEIELDFKDNKTYSVTYKVDGNEQVLKNLQTTSLFSNKDLSFKLDYLSPKTQGKYVFVLNSRESIKNYLIANLNVANASPNILFSLRSENGAKSEFIIQQVIKGFLALDQRENSEKIENSIIYIKNYIDTINLQLRESQLEKTNYVKANAVYDPATQLQNNLAEVETYHQKIDELDAKVYSINRLKNEINNSSSKVENSYSGEDRELSVLINERNKMLIDYKPSHPTVTVVNRQIKERLISLNNNLRLEIDNYKNQIGQYRSRKSQAQSSLISMPEKDMEFNKIQKEVEIKEKYVIDLIEKQIQYLIIKSSISSDYLVIQPPKTSPEQIFPKSTLLYGTAIVFFLLTSFLLVLFRYIKFDKVVSIDEVKRKTKVPILGYVPFVEEAYDETNVNKNSPESRIVVLDNPKSRTSEVFKKMRASLKYTSHSDYKTVCSTSTISGEGKTFVLINLAAVHALLDKKVLIIDLDMRKPRIAKSFKLSNKIGMSNLLSDDTIKIEDCIQQNKELANLYVITSGPIPPNPSELILSDRFDKVLEELKKRYDYIFIDTPPVGLVNESIEIVNKVDIPLYLVKFNYSRKDFFNVLNDTNQLKKASNLYLVINHYGEGASSYVNYNYGGYAYGYGYNQSYGYGYNSDYHKSSEGYYTDTPKIRKISKWDKLGKIFDWNL